MRFSANCGVRVAVLAALVLVPATATMAEPGDRIAEVFAARVSLQKQLAGWIEGTLRELAAPHHLLVTVQLRMRGEFRDLVKREGAPDSELKIGSHKAMKLPGLPLVDKPLGGVAAPDISVKVPGNQKIEVQRQLESQVERIAVRLFVEQGIPAPELDRLKEVASSLAGLDPARGDVLEVTEVAGHPPGSRAGVSGAVLLACATAFLSCLLLAAGIAWRGGRMSRAGVQAGEHLQSAEKGGARAQVGESAEVPVDAGVSDVDAGEHGRPRAFGFLNGATADELLDVLGEIDPSVAAAVLDKAQLEGAVLRRIFEAVPKDRQLAIAVNLGRSHILPRSTVDQAEELVRAALERSRSRVKVGGESRLADILAEAPESAQRDLLEQLERSDPGLAQAIRSKMLLFEELSSFPPTAVRQVVTGVDPAILALALSGASSSVKEAVMNAASKRLRGILEAEIEAMPQSRPSDVESARRTVERVMRRVQSQGGVHARVEATA